MPEYYWESEQSHGRFCALDDEDALSRLSQRGANKMDPPWCLYTEDADGEFHMVAEWPH
jgi:hypothetical protein